MKMDSDHHTVGQSMWLVYNDLNVEIEMCLLYLSQFYGRRYGAPIAP